jgi:chaperonin GroEL
MGNDWGLFDPATGLGTASSVTIGRDSTTIIHESEDLNEIVSERVALIREQLEDEKREDFIAAARARISMLEGNAAVIYVGGDSDIEKKEKKDRVDDSVLATRAAIEEGILPGGGVALLNESNIAMESEDINVVAAAFILGSALQVPFKQILTNAGKNPEDFIGDDRIGGENGYNSKTEQYGNMYDMGIIDPAKVTKNALKNAVSVATTIMMTDTVITNVRDMGQQ